MAPTRRLGIDAAGPEEVQARARLQSDVETEVFQRCLPQCACLQLLFFFVGEISLDLQMIGVQVSGQRIQRYLGPLQQLFSQVGQGLLLERLPKACQRIAQAMPALRHELGQLQVACAL
ncbi:hypothetical protein D9M71_207140 [compost metagenome]